MTTRNRSDGDRKDEPQPASQAGADERKTRVLTHGTPSITSGIADAVVVKDGDVFFLAGPDGNVPCTGGHGLGLYYHDCRFLSGYELRAAGMRLDPLVSTATKGFTAVFELTNPDIRTEDGTLVRKQDLGITWTRVVDGRRTTLRDTILFHNFGITRVKVPVSLAFDADFADVYAVRGLLPDRPGTRRPPDWSNGRLCLVYDGKDGRHRSVTIGVSPRPLRTRGTGADFRIALDPGEERHLLVTLLLTESTEASEVSHPRRDQPDVRRIESLLSRSSDEWLGEHTTVTSDSLVFNRLMERSLRDLRVLRSHFGEEAYFAAGVPWFATLFGRDSLVAALETLAFRPAIAEQTLRLLAARQGDRVDEWRDEEPGKILHELRVGELAALDEIPQTPYYGTVDATPLFLVLVARHAAWTGDLRLFTELRSHVDRALEWMASRGDRNGDGYIEYQSHSEKGLVNQGWKDSGDAIVNADGSLATPPISLVEVQAYAYLAKTAVAELFRRAGEPDRADRLEREAEALRERFNRDFWLEALGTYALALEAGGRPCAVVTSNPGHALFAGIADRDKADRTAARLMADDMWSGWGIRTLSREARRYNPIGYHLGTVWPHDNAIVAAGLRRYGHDDAARRIFVGILEASMHFRAYRLPELFAGFSRRDYEVPVHYPVACHPQAWASGSVPYLVESLLGLAPEAFERRLRIVRPTLPRLIHVVELRGLRVGEARVDLRFERISDRRVASKVLEVDGRLDVVMEPETETAPAG